MTVLLLAVLWGEVPVDCRTFADEAKEWLLQRHVEVWESMVAETPPLLILRMNSGAVRNTKGRRVFNVQARYVPGGTWFTPLRDGRLYGWRGRMELVQQDGGPCRLSLRVSFLPEPDDGEISRNPQWDEYWPIESNGRLEREYVDAIQRRLRVKRGR